MAYGWRTTEKPVKKRKGVATKEGKTLISLQLLIFYTQIKLLLL